MSEGFRIRTDDETAPAAIADEVENSLFKLAAIAEPNNIPKLGDWSNGKILIEHYIDVMHDLRRLSHELNECAGDGEQIESTNERITFGLHIIGDLMLEAYADLLPANNETEESSVDMIKTTEQILNGLITIDISKYRSKIENLVAITVSKDPDHAMSDDIYVKYATPPVRQAILRNAFNRLLREPVPHDIKPPAHNASVEKFIINTWLDESTDYAKDAADVFVSHVGSEMIDIIDAWATNEKTEEPGALEAYLTECVRAFARVWNECGREATLRLYRHYGIRHFHYFPHKVLVEQAQHTEPDPTKRFGIIMLSHNDHNKAFVSIRSVTQSAWDGIHDTHDIVCAEAKHRHEILRRLSRIRKAYGNDINDAQADFILLGAHGNPDSMVFGEQSEPKQQLTSTDIVSNASPALANKILQPDGQVVLVSCSTGAIGGFAQTAATFFDRTVIAPDTTTNINSLSFTRGNDHHITSITPKFWEGTNAHSFSPNAALPTVKE